MEFLSLDHIWGFIFLFFPGFVSVKVYHALVASDKYDFSKDLLGIIGYSVLNLFLNFWLLWLNLKYSWIFTEALPFYFSCLWLLFISPILWPLLIKYLLGLPFAKKHLIGNKKSAWDFYFNQRKGCWLIINLKNGERIGGNYSEKSYATSYPCKESIYLEEVWDLWEPGNEKKFKQIVQDTKGILILSDNINTIEFYN